jgi:hypothetical protein
MRAGFVILSRVNHPPILLGTSSFTAVGWSGAFYPPGLKPSDYLALYAERQFLSQLRGKTALLHIRPHADWMSKRSHRNLL